MKEAPLSKRQLWGLAVVFALANIVIHLPFLFRYDLYFQSDIAVCHLMAKRMLYGEFSVYNWGADYGGIGPVDFLTAVLFAIVGASIPLSGFVSLLFWAAGVGVLTAYTGMCFGKRAAIAVGCALAVGVPHFLMYCTQPLSSTYPQAALYLGGFFWLTVALLRRGPASKLSLFVALLMGWFWYAHKQVLVVWVSIGVALLAMPQGREFLKQFVRSRMALLAAMAFLVGYSPEIAYKMGWIGDQGERVPDTKRFLQVATPELMSRNWYYLFRCIPTYFDADPWSRNHSSVHYLNHMENWESFPLDASDTVGILAAFLVIGFLLHTARESYREKNLPVFLLAVVPLVDAFIIVISGMAGGAYYGIRRYLLPAGILFQVWLGVRFSRDFAARRWVTSGVLALAVLISLYHQKAMLDIPDQLADYKTTAADIEKSGYKYGLSWFSYSHTLTALTDERVQFGIIDRRFQSPYQKPALEQDVVAVVWPAVTAPPFEFAQQLFFGGVRFKDDSIRMLPDSITVFGREYRRVGEQKRNGELAWAPYRKGAPVMNPSLPPN